MPLTQKPKTTKSKRAAKAIPKSVPQKKSATSKKNRGKYDPVAPERVAEILKRLDAQYPHVTCALHHKTAWELLAATILSAQCTDRRVNMGTPELFRKYPTPHAFAALKPQQLAPGTLTTGFFRNNSSSVAGAAHKLD